MKATANTVRVTEYWPVEAEHRVAKAAKPMHPAKAVALACAAPFIGLAYVVALPFAGAVALAWFALRALARHYPGVVRTVKNIALFLAAPFIGLAYAIAFPFVGVGALVWMAVRAARKRPA